MDLNDELQKVPVIKYIKEELNNIVEQKSKNSINVAALALAAFIFFFIMAGAGCHLSLSSSDEEQTTSPQENSNSIVDMSYDEYFSEERKFAYPQNIQVVNDWYYCVNPDTGYLCEAKIDYEVDDVPTYVSVNTDYIGDDNNMQCLEKYIVYICDSHQLIQMDKASRATEILYESKEEITDLRANETLLFFMGEQGIYRYFFPSKTLDLLCTFDEMETTKEDISTWEPLSNFTVRYSVYSSYYKSLVEKGFNPYDDMDPSYQIPDGEYLRRSYNYNGKTKIKEETSFNSEGAVVYEVKINELTE